MADVFLSYAREDAERAAAIARHLQDAGWTVFWDRRVVAGSLWEDVIERELRASRCVVVLWSAASVGSRWVRTEARFALNRNTLVPASIDGTEPPLAFQFVEAAQLHAWNGDIDDPEFAILTDGIAQHSPRVTPAVVVKSADFVEHVGASPEIYPESRQTQLFTEPTSPGASEPPHVRAVDLRETDGHDRVEFPTQPRSSIPMVTAAMVVAAAIVLVAIVLWMQPSSPDTPKAEPTTTQALNRPTSEPVQAPLDRPTTETSPAQAPLNRPTTEATQTPKGPAVARPASGDGTVAQPPPARNAEKAPDVPAVQHVGYSSFADPAYWFSIEFPREWQSLTVNGSGEARGQVHRVAQRGGRRRGTLPG